MVTEIIVDATDGMVGRVASYAAKQALLGKKVILVNCREALVTGKQNEIMERYKQAVARGGSAQKGPNFPRSPERIMKRTVRGMLSFRQLRGREALKRIICYNKTPAEYEAREKISLKRPVKFKAMKLSRITEIL